MSCYSQMDNNRPQIVNILKQKIKNKQKNKQNYKQTFVSYHVLVFLYFSNGIGLLQCV